MKILEDLNPKWTIKETQVLRNQERCSLLLIRSWICESKVDILALQLPLRRKGNHCQKD